MTSEKKQKLFDESEEFETTKEEEEIIVESEKSFVYEDPIDRQNRLIREEQEAVAEIKRKHNEKIDVMVDNIREMETELRELNKQQLIDDEAEAKERRIGFSIADMDETYYKFVVSILGNALQIFLVYLTLTIVGLLLGEPVDDGGDVEEEDDGPKQFVLPNVRDVTFKNPEDEVRRLEEDHYSLQNNTLNVQSLQKSAEEKRPSHSILQNFGNKLNKKLFNTLQIWRKSRTMYSRWMKMLR